jgi:hypothetical protein
MSTTAATMLIATIATAMQPPSLVNGDKGGTSNQQSEPARDCKSPNAFKDNNENGFALCRVRPL